MTALAEETTETVHRLIQSCRTSEHAFHMAAEAAEDENLKRLLALYAHQRTRFARELEEHVAGGPHGEAGAGRTSFWEISGGEPTDAALLRQCLQTDGNSLTVYKEALTRRIPSKAHFLISAQIALMQRGHERMQGMLSAAPQEGHITVTSERARV